MTGRVDGKVIGITGGASGMGRAFAEAFAKEGAAVLIVDLNPEAAEATAAKITADGGRAAWAAANVVERDAVASAVQTAVREFGRLDVWFNNAGFNKPMHLLDVTEDNWRSIMDVNGLGVLIGVQEAAKQMIAQGGGGKIINTASIASRQGYPSIVPYCASKAAVVSITQAAARGLAADDITVNAFAPGVVATPLWKQLDEDLMNIGDSEKPGEAMEAFAQDIIRGRAATAEDIVGTALYLASGDSDYLTGQVIMIDGGMVLV